MNDADRQLLIWNAIRGTTGAFRAARKYNAERQITSGKRQQKDKGKGVRLNRNKKFQWLFNTTGERIPLRNSFGCP